MGGGYGLPSNQPLYCQRVILREGYAPDGTYWGIGDRLYCLFDADLEVMQYVRAPDARYARFLFRKIYGELAFKREMK
jgi:hypothetical protein